MKTTFGALALCVIAFVLSSNAVGQTPIGEWQLIKILCEGGKTLDDSFSGTNNRLIFDDITRTQILDFSHADEDYKTDDCVLHVKANYSITGNQYRLGPFLELTSPMCPLLAKELQDFLKYSISHLRDQYGDNVAIAVKHFQEIKARAHPPRQFQISNSNQKLKISLSVEQSNDVCPGQRVAKQYERIK